MPNWSSIWGEKTVPVLFAGRNPQDVPGYAGGTAGFYTGWCNKRWRRSVGQEADGRVAAPPSLKGLVGLLYERSLKKCEEARGAQDNGMASPSRPSKTSQAGTIFPLRADTRLGAPARTTSSTTRWQEWPSGHA